MTSFRPFGRRRTTISRSHDPDQVLLPTGLRPPKVHEQQSLKPNPPAGNRALPSWQCPVPPQTRRAHRGCVDAGRGLLNQERRDDPTELAGTHTFITLDPLSKLVDHRASGRISGLDPSWDRVGAKPIASLIY